MRHFDLQLWVCYFTIITFDRVFFRCFLVCSSCLLIDASHSILIFFSEAKKGFFFQNSGCGSNNQSCSDRITFEIVVGWTSLCSAEFVVLCMFAIYIGRSISSAKRHGRIWHVFFQLKRISTKKKNKTCSTSTFPRVSTYLHILYRELTYPTWQKGK